MHRSRMAMNRPAGWGNGSHARQGEGLFKMVDISQAKRVSRRSVGALQHRRVPLEWPAGREFRILSIDGGGIRGIFPAAYLAGLEERYLGGCSVASRFDLITGTSTGGIIAVGLGAGLRASDLRDLYVERGWEVFPPAGALARRAAWLSRLFRYRYSREALAQVLHEYLGDRTLGESGSRLCIPSCEGRHSDLYVFKTPHHPDYRLDAAERMVKVAAATSAAPTYFRPLDDGGYTFVDGGVWANNPVMIGLTEALTCFSTARERIRILSLGCGDVPYKVKGWKKRLGGMLAWRDVISGAMRFQSLGALGQAGLLIGGDRITRIDLPEDSPPIDMDDWLAARAALPAAAAGALDRSGAHVALNFLQDPADAYEPFPTGETSTQAALSLSATTVEASQNTEARRPRR